VSILPKLLILAVTAPLWVRVLRALWAEMNEALEPEGGLFGGWKRDPKIPRNGGGLVHRPRFPHRLPGHPGRPRGLAASVRTRRLRP
jgi:hypothetical protein